MQSVHIDFETCSDLDLKKVGVFAYAEHPSTDILCLVAQAPGGAPQAWQPGQPLPAILRTAEKFSAWNATFEWVIWNVIGVRRYGFPPAARACFDNPQARAMSINLPASLDGTAAAMNLDVRKDKEGKRLMQKMAKRKDITPENVTRLIAYCAQDVAVETAVDTRLQVSLTPKEERVYALSERINKRGVMIDLPFARLAAQAVADYQHHVGATMEKRYGFGPRQVQEIGAFCAKHRVPLPDLRADTVEAVLALREFLPGPVIDVLEMRQKAAAAAPGKYAAMLRAVNSDGRLRGMFNYCGAGQTGRWSGRIVQLHNLARPTMEMDYALAYMEILRREQRWQALGDDPLDVLLNCLRPTLIPGDAAVFTAGDEAAIEARVLAWLAGEEEPLKVFSTPGGDIYLHAAERIYHRPITKADKSERQIGKVATLALGYGGGKGAFVTMGRGYGVHVAEDEAEKIKLAWRDAHKRINALWSVMEITAMRVLPTRPETRRYGKNVDDVAAREVQQRLFGKDGLRMEWIYQSGAKCLYLKLPSGRVLAYQNAQVREGLQPALYKLALEELRKSGKEPTAQDLVKARNESLRMRIEFDVPAGEHLVRETTYGGKLSENLTQAVARDVLAEAMLRVDDLPLVMHVHDEIVAEGDHKVRMQEALTDPIDWAPGLPLGAEVTTLPRYWK